MNRFLQRSFFMLLLLIGFTYAASAQTVYTTKTGAKYHNDGCRYLSKSKIQTTVKDAKASGYIACKVCKPPISLRNSHSIEQNLCFATAHHFLGATFIPDITPRL